MYRFCSALHNNNLYGIIPSELGNCTELEGMYVLIVVHFPSSIPSFCFSVYLGQLSAFILVVDDIKIVQFCNTITLLLTLI